MSDYIIRFIPEDIHINLSENSIKIIEKLDWFENFSKFMFNEKIHFADAGHNFESVKCPLCKADLMEWWGNAMGSAYSDEEGFFDIMATTPCCRMKTSLHNLDYSFPQGFYKIMIEVMPELNSQITPENISNNLLDITGEKWRIIRAHY